NTTAITPTPGGIGITASPRTFGEAQIDFDAITAGTTGCFASAYLKSRSSDSFTAALKDFIAPVALNICGTVRVIKTEDGAGTLLGGSVFTLVTDNPPIDNPGGPVPGKATFVATCTTVSGECTFTNVVQGQYWVVEITPPAGHDLASPPFQSKFVSAAATVT